MSYTAIPAAFELFRQSLSTRAIVVTPASPTYPESIKRWSTAAEKKAAIVVFPTTDSDVSKALLFAQTHGLDVAVKGGGHSTSGSSSTEGGLCIDLCKMKGVVVDAEKKTVTAQGGATWADVDAEAAKFGLACVGGTVNTTGIGGLTQGGGYGWLTGTHGLSIDNLLSTNIVLASGTVITASLTENTDIFWAIRGAGALFGVITSFTFRAHAQPDTVWGGLLVFPKEKLGPIVEFGNHLLENAKGNHAMFIAFGAPPPGIPVVMLVLVSNTSSSTAEAFFKPLLDLESLANTTKSMLYPESNAMLNESAVSGFRRTQKGSVLATPMSVDIVSSLFEDFEKFLIDVKDADHSIVILELHCTEKVVEVGQEETAFANRGDFVSVLFGLGWNKEEFDGDCREWSRRMASKLKDEYLKTLKSNSTEDMNKTAVGEYGNYDGLNSKAEVLFGVNFPRLKVLKRKFDPTNVFSGGPDLLA